MKFWQMLVVLVTLGDAMPTTAQDTPAVMDGFPPSTESQGYQEESSGLALQSVGVSKFWCTE